MSYKYFESVNQSQFRQSISSRDKKCLVTGCHECECDACHIIPLYICQKFNLPFQYDRRNGILITKSLHTLFDKFVWTLDIYNLQIKDNKYWFKLLIKPNHLNLSINPYQNQYINIAIECYPFMYIHYQMFIATNYEIELNVPKLYNEIITQDKVFNYLYENQIPTQALLQKNLVGFLIEKKIIEEKKNNEYPINAILQHKTIFDEDYYFIWWDYLPYSEASWEPHQHLKKHTIQSYRQSIDEQKDSTFQL